MVLVFISFIGWKELLSVMFMLGTCINQWQNVINWLYITSITKYINSNYLFYEDMINIILVYELDTNSTNLWRKLAEIFSQSSVVNMSVQLPVPYRYIVCSFFLHLYETSTTPTFLIIFKTHWNYSTVISYSGKMAATLLLLYGSSRQPYLLCLL